MTRNHKVPARPRSALRCTLFAILGGAAQMSLAQPGREATSESSGAAQLDEIVVTAQKVSQRLQDVPITITELSAADLARTNVTTTAELPTLVSGLVWSNQGAWVLPSLRGISSSVSAIGSSSPVAIYLDGIYQPMEAGGILDLPDVQRIEVLKGPQGTLFGRNATGGAISIFTADPSFMPTGKMSLSAGYVGGGSSRDSGHYQLSGYASGPLVSDVLAGSISANFDRLDGYLNNDVTGDAGGRVNAEDVRGKLLWNPADGVSFLGTAYYTHREDGIAMAGFPYNGVTAASLYPGAVVPSEPWHYAFDGPTPDVRVNGRGGSLKGTFELTAGTLTSITGYSTFDTNIFGTSEAASSPGCIAVFSCVTANIVLAQDTASQEFDFASKKVGQLRFVGGLYGFWSRNREHDSYNAGAFTDETVVRNTSYAAFGEANYDVTDQLSAIAGVRVTREQLNATGSLFGAPLEPYANKSWTSTTPRFSLLYKINPIVNTYFTYSQGFKAGVVSGQSAAAPPANPEKLTAFEVGVKAATAQFMGNLSVFYYNYKDLQVESLINGGTITVPQNAARAKIFGVDLDGAYKWNERFETRLNTTYLGKAEYSSFANAIAYVPPLGPFGFVTDNFYDASGSRMLVAPLWTGTIAQSYTQPFAAGVLQADASLYFSSGYRWVYTGTVKTSSYNTLNGRVSFTPKDSNFKYSLYGKNLTNKAYINGETPNPVTAVTFFSRPREIGLALELSY